MKDAVKFVSHAFKAGPQLPDTVPHYIIRDGRITAAGYAVAISAPFPDVPDCCPRADLFRAAIDKAGDSVAFDLSRSALNIRSKGLRVAVPVLAERPYQPLPHGDTYAPPAGFLAAVKRVAPFVAEDDARPHVKAVGLWNGCYTATNNVTAVQHYTGHGLPGIAFPDLAVKTLIRENKEPESIQISDYDITLYYEDERWVKVMFYQDPFPFEQINRILDEGKAREFQAMPEGLAKALDRITPFADKESPKLYFRNGGIATSQENGAGAHVECNDLPEGLAFGPKPLRLLADNAELVSWDKSAKHYFKADKGFTRGAIMGLRS